MPSYAPVETPVGTGFVAYTDRGVLMISPGRTEAAFLREAERRLGMRPVHRDPPASFTRRLAAAITAGDGSLVDWDAIPGFQRAVLRATARIPVGEVRSYAQVAGAAGSPRAVRASGTALATNPVPFLVPCHRVVRSDGSLGNYGFGSDAKRALLVGEGALTTRAARASPVSRPRRAPRSGRTVR